MFSCKTILKSILAFSVVVPVIACASPALVLNNNVKSPSTSLINGKCTDSIPGLGSFGTTPACAKKHEISGFLVQLACGYGKTECNAKIYSDTSCHGAYIADVKFNINTGIIDITQNPENHDYSVTGSGFNVSLNTTKPGQSC